MRLRTFGIALKAAVRTFNETLRGKEDTIFPAPPATAQLCEDEKACAKANEVMRAIALNPAMRDISALRFAASGLEGASVIPQNAYYGLDIDPDDYPTVIRWMIDPSKRTDIILFIPQRDTNALRAEEWVCGPKVGLANGATPEDAITVLGWYAGRVRRGQIPASS